MSPDLMIRAVVTSGVIGMVSRVTLLPIVKALTIGKFS